MKKVTVLLITILMMAVSLVGCGGNDDTIQTCIISNSSYSLQEELESANQEDALIGHCCVRTGGRAGSGWLFEA